LSGCADGSEVRSIELERLIEQGIGQIGRRNAFEFCRDTAVERFEAVTGPLALAFLCDRSGPEADSCLLTWSG